MFCAPLNPDSFLGQFATVISTVAIACALITIIVFPIVYMVHLAEQK